MQPQIMEPIAASAGGAPGLWTWAFMVGSYLAAAGCLFWGIREGARTHWRRGLYQAGLFGIFALTFWLVESWAHQRAPYYVYSAAFGDLLPRFPFERLGLPGGAADLCTRWVTGNANPLLTDRIPLSIVLMAAALTYSALWTARLLGSNLIVQPLLAGLVMLNIDLFLDPVLATSHECQTGAALPRAGIGLGLWQWFLPADSAAWYEVPIYNYAAWFAAPLFLVAMTGLLGPFFRDWLLPRVRRSLESPSGAPAGWQGALLLAIALSAAVVAQTVPGKLSPWLQQLLFGGLALSALAVVLGYAWTRRYEIVEGVAGPLTLPTAIALTLPSLVLWWEGFFLEVPSLIPVSLFAVGFGFFVAFLPYRGAVISFCDRVIDVDRFVRFHYFGFSAMLVLLGAGSVRADPDQWLIGGLLLVAGCYHVFGYVLNDVIDLDLDRQQTRRQNDPQVRGSISRETALAFALVPVPVAAVVSFLLGASAAAWGALAAAFALGFAYNRWGKVCPVPPFTDLLQGLGWGALALFGALIADPALTPFGLPALAGPLLAFAVGFILLINGVHGGLRDLWTDLQNQKRTTALFLGADRSFDGTPHADSSRGVILFAFAVHTAMYLPFFLFVGGGAAYYASAAGHAVVQGALGALFVGSSYVLWRVVKKQEAHRAWWISTHLFVMMLPPLVLYLPASPPTAVFKLLVVMALAVPLALQVGSLERLAGALRALERQRIAHRRGDGAAPDEPPGRQPPTPPPPGPPPPAAGS